MLSHAYLQLQVDEHQLSAVGFYLLLSDLLEGRGSLPILTESLDVLLVILNLLNLVQFKFIEMGNLDDFLL